MSFRAVRVYLVQLFVILFLTACSSGSSEETGNTVTGTSGRISLAVLDSNNNNVTSIAAGTTATAQVTLTTTTGLPVSSNEVSFSTSSGTLSAASRLTDANGLAEVTFNSSGLTPSVVTITASATYNGEALSITSQFEIAEDDASSPTLQLQLISGGESTNRFTEGDSAELSVRVFSADNLPIEDTLVTFTAGLGTLTPSTALTNSNGQASVELTSVIGQVGAATATASVTINEQTYTTSPLAYEIEELDSAVLSLTVLDQNNSETTSITEGNKLTLHANLVGSNGAAISEHAIDFTTTAGAFSAASRLTGSTGLATVTYDSTSIAAGVVTVTASATYNNDNLSVSKQFEVLQANGEGTGTPELNITFKKDGSSTNRIQTDETAQIGVVLTSESGDPIDNTIVNFTADLGTLSANSALTDSDGIAEVTITGTAAQLGAGLATASTSINNITITDSLPYEVVDSDVVVDSTLKLGHLDDNGNFQTGIKSKLTNSNAESTISAGGTLGLELGIFDQDNNVFTSPLSVTFTSTCLVAGTATLDTSVTTINGIATTTFEDVSCATAFGNEDTVVATVTVNSTDLTATHDVNIQAENLGSVEFVSATPESIVIKGTGGQGNQETSTLTFSVKGELGNALAQQNVEFELNTDVGGLSLAATSGVTNSEGLVSAKVISGTVPTAVRVTARVTNENSETITTQSDLLSVNTGLPDQNSITLALTELNPETYQTRLGTQVTVTAFMADSFNNPVPDGTTINFTTEGGSITPSCNTTSGICTATWTNQEPFEDDHRITILATAIGHEYFVDLNGNNIFDSDDGSAVESESISSGFGRISNLSSGFIDMSEAWRDDNENNSYDEGEQFIDSVTSGSSLNNFDTPDGLFNGPQCEGSLCATAEGQTSIIVRKSIRLITSGSAAKYFITDPGQNTTYASGSTTTTSTTSVTLGNGTNLPVRLQLSDSADQTLPVGTTISLSATGATLQGTSAITVANTIGTTDPDGFGGLDFNISLLNEVTEADNGEFVVTITTPAGIVTQITIPLILSGP